MAQTKNNKNKQTKNSKQTTKKQPAKGKEKQFNGDDVLSVGRSRSYMLAYFAAFAAFVMLLFIRGKSLWASMRIGIFAFFGMSVYLLDILFLIIGVLLALEKIKRRFAVCNIGAALMVISFAGFATVIALSQGSSDFGVLVNNSMLDGRSIPENGLTFTGGILGGVFGGAFMSLVGKGPAVVTLLVLFAVGVFMTFGIPLKSFGEHVAGGINRSKEKINDLSGRYSESKAHRQEVREVRREERQITAEEKRLQLLEERRRRNAERKAANEKRREEFDINEPFVVTLDNGDVIRSDVNAEQDRINRKRNKLSSQDVPYAPKTNENPSFDGNRTVTGLEYSVDGVSEYDLDEPFRVIHASSYIPSSKSKPIKSATSTFVEKTQPEPDEPKPVEVKETVALDNDSASVINAATEQYEQAQIKNRTDVEGYKEPKVREQSSYLTPPIDCLAEPEFTSDFDSEWEMNEVSKKLIETLQSFNVETHIVGASRGPSVTRYELQPAMGVRINKITNLIDDIALNLAVAGIRIEAPIPGKSAVGIEVPNKSRATVYLREIIASDEYSKATKKSKLNVAIGKDIAGQVCCADLAKMPHLLVAGTTGSGKSVTMNDMIVSLLYNASPEDVKILLIDPKQVEFAVYNGIPHLYVPVISDAKKASGALTWAVTEMERRYKLFTLCGVRDLKSYNKYIKENPDPDDIMHSEPQVVIFIDELADLMMVSPKEVEDAICRLAQKARAAGMHLVVATQRPSVDVVTGLIKANIPSRLALSVSSQVDSRTILDSAGAERLLGNGDLLFNPLGVTKPVRIQGAFVSDDEIEHIVDFLKDKTMPDYDNSIMEQIDKYAAEAGTGKGSEDAGDKVGSSDKVDAMFDDVLKFACEAGEISGSLIMRKFSLGYGRSAKIIDQMLERGYLGDTNTSTKKRPVLLSVEEYWRLKDSGSIAAPTNEQVSIENANKELEEADIGEFMAANESENEDVPIDSTPPMTFLDGEDEDSKFDIRGEDVTDYMTNEEADEIDIRPTLPPSDDDDDSAPLQSLSPTDFFNEPIDDFDIFGDD